MRNFVNIQLHSLYTLHIKKYSHLHSDIHLIQRRKDQYLFAGIQTYKIKDYLFSEKSNKNNLKTNHLFFSEFLVTIVSPKIYSV